MDNSNLISEVNHYFGTIKEKYNRRFWKIRKKMTRSDARTYGITLSIYQVNSQK